MKREESATTSKAFIRAGGTLALSCFFSINITTMSKCPYCGKTGTSGSFRVLFFSYLIFSLLWHDQRADPFGTLLTDFSFSIVYFAERCGQFLVAFFLFHFYWPLIRRLSDSSTTARSTIRLACGLWPRRRRRNAASLCSRASLPIFSFNHY